MIKEAIYHKPVNQYAYSYDKNHLHIMLQAKRADLESVQLIFGDPYDFNGSQWNYHLKSMKKSGSSQSLDYWKIEIEPAFRRMRYGFLCQDKNGGVSYFTEKGHTDELPEQIGAYFCFPYLHEVDIFTAPSWVKDTIWYQIFPERFANGNPTWNPTGTLSWGEHKPTPDNFFGGDLQGVIDHLDYLVELGITGIYFCPIFKASSNHKYDTIDYFELDPQFGDKQTLRKLVRDCHKRGIRVMLDAVFNHSGFEFTPFQDVLKHGQKSKYKDWFHIWDFPIQTSPHPNYDAFGFVASMPKLNTTNPEVKDYLLRVGRYWIEEFDIDGWRLDVANEIDHTFWRAFRNEMKSIKPDLYILGEIWHDSMKWLQGDQFDAVMNYPLRESIIDFFAAGAIRADQFDDRLTDLLHMYPDNVQKVLFNLLDSHDTDRVLTLANGNKDRVKLMYVFLLSFIGTPCLYYGDEIGMAGGGDPECRACMEWDREKQDLELFTFVQNLIRIRKEEPAFGSDAAFKMIQADAEKNLLVYEKKNSKAHLVFIINNNDFEQKLNIVEMAGKQTRALFNEPAVNLHEDGTIKLPPYGFQCYQLL
ncbi:glycoside hydrolase family 13 protein [Amphibacillus sediminis]|uniref:glycoside hydrolase family 13 protein n=1 Tax=Amphibacillus sediminis TaxID=360185 RepID=UPI00082C5A82|nr:glycoside hydrolase family 13 protein [Amphibacillus sediminis]